MDILAALDLSNNSPRVLERAKSMALAYKSKLWLLHVAEPAPDMTGYKLLSRGVRDFRAKEYHREHRAIQLFTASMREEGIDASSLLVQGDYAETILALATKLAVDMIVIGSQGKGLSAELVLESVSAGVIRGANVPVLIVPITHTPSY